MDAVVESACSNSFKPSRAVATSAFGNQTPLALQGGPQDQINLSPFLVLEPRGSRESVSLSYLP